MSDQYAAARHRMVTEQLSRRGLTDPNVLATMDSIPRELFVPEQLASNAYTDRALPIADGQTISQPLIVAMMTEALELSGTEKVLEIGTGSGYQAAVLSRLSRHVVSMERHADLSQTALQTLDQLGCDNVSLRIGDGSLGWPEEAPYDRIIVTAAAPRCPTALWQQLNIGGLIVIPVGPYDAQILQQIRKLGDGAARTIDITSCRFVPLIGAGL